ncbi:MAG: glycosyltransferase [Nitrospinota bacterium]
MEKISVFIINYNGMRTIRETIRSLYAQKKVELTIQVIDDGSTDGSLEMVNEEFPEIVCHVQPENTAQLNKLRNIAIHLAQTEYLLVSDNDIVFDEKCVCELFRGMGSDPNVAICTPKLMFLDDRSRIYSGNTKMHFVAAAISPDRGHRSSAFVSAKTLQSGGGILLIRKEAVASLGGFDEDYKMAWGDDGELYQRLLLSGMKCFYIQAAFAYHENKPFSPARRYRASGQVYNRWLYIMTQYSFRTIFFLLPALFLYEVLQCCFMSTKGMFFLYVRTNCEVLGSLPLFLKKRGAIQKRREVSDRDIVFSGPIYVSPSVLKKSAIVKIAMDSLNVFYGLYWKAVRVLL